MKSGPEQLLNWMVRRWPNSERPQRETAAHFGWDETYLSRVIRGKRIPGLVNSVKIERETGIPVEAWLSSEQDNSEPVAAGPARKRKPAKG